MDSDKPIGKEHATPNAKRKANKPASHTKPPAPPTSAESESHPTEAQHEITCRPEKRNYIYNSAQTDWWKKTKPFLEIAGVVLLAVYTAYTIKMYYANKEAADAAASAAATAAEALNQSRRYDLRPYVSVTKLETVGELKEGHKIKGRAEVVN